MLSPKGNITFTFFSESGTKDFAKQKGMQSNDIYGERTTLAIEMKDGEN